MRMGKGDAFQGADQSTRVSQIADYSYEKCHVKNIKNLQETIKRVNGKRKSMNNNELESFKLIEERINFVL